MNTLAKVVVGAAVAGVTVWAVKKLCKNPWAVVDALANVAASVGSIDDTPKTITYKETQRDVKTSGLEGAMSASDKERTEVRVKLTDNGVGVEKRHHVAREADVVDFQKAASKLSKTEGHDKDGYTPIKIK